MSYDNIRSCKKQGFTLSLENTALKKPHSSTFLGLRFYSAWFTDEIFVDFLLGSFCLNDHLLQALYN